jgi:DNA-binding protein
MAKKTVVKATTEKKEADENVVYIGNKPLMSYVQALVTEFGNNGSKGVVIKARGRAINMAVDAAEVTINRFIKDAEVKDIKIGTESLPNRKGKISNVSSIEIHLMMKKKGR